MALSLGLVLEEGLDRATLEAEIEAVARAADRAGVRIVCGDTKVVERGKADQLYLNTSGIGMVDERAELDRRRIRLGDRMIVSGPIGDHGVAIMLARGDLDLQAAVSSDTRSLWPAVDALLDACGSGLRWMRDATRGGVATVANELVLHHEVGLLIDEGAVPVRPAVAGACELLGIDPLYVANEGTLVAVVAAEAVGAALEVLRSTEGGAQAAVIGEIVDDPPGRVLGRTVFGGHRMIDFLVGDPLPRIC
jgi:hydrogenase expression/formation protein HypE